MHLGGTRRGLLDELPADLKKKVRKATSLAHEKDTMAEAMMIDKY